MCGRYTLTRRQSDLMERFAIDRSGFEIAPRFNIAPSQKVSVVVDDAGKRVMEMFVWGLIPSWTKDLTKTKAMINARSETLFEKPFFRQSASKRRCLVLADGFYEWQKSAAGKVPMFIHLPEQAPFAMAGVWDRWTNADGEVIRTCSIVTTAANPFMEPVHDRMPVILSQDEESSWLDHKVTDVATISRLFHPYSGEMQMHAVSSRVNSPSQDLPELLEPVPMQMKL